MHAVRIILFGVVFLVAVSLFIPSFNDGDRPARTVKAENAVRQLVTAAEAYNEEYGEPPRGDRKAILRALQNDNPRKVVFLEISPKDLSTDGIYLDPWGTPYAFDLSTSSPWAYSFGKDRIDEGGNGDDVASWK